MQPWCIRAALRELTHRNSAGAPWRYVERAASASFARWNVASPDDLPFSHLSVNSTGSLIAAACGNSVRLIGTASLACVAQIDNLAAPATYLRFFDCGTKLLAASSQNLQVFDLYDDERRETLRVQLAAMAAAIVDKGFVCKVRREGGSSRRASETSAVKLHGCEILRLGEEEAEILVSFSSPRTLPCRVTLKNNAVVSIFPLVKTASGNADFAVIAVPPKVKLSGAVVAMADEGAAVDDEQEAVRDAAIPCPMVTRRKTSKIFSIWRSSFPDGYTGGEVLLYYTFPDKGLLLSRLTETQQQLEQLAETAASLVGLSAHRELCVSSCGTLVALGGGERFALLRLQWRQAVSDHGEYFFHTVFVHSNSVERATFGGFCFSAAPESTPPKLLCIGKSPDGSTAVLFFSSDGVSPSEAPAAGCDAQILRMDCAKGGKFVQIIWCPGFARWAALMEREGNFIIFSIPPCSHSWSFTLPDFEYLQKNREAVETEEEFDDLTEVEPIRTTPNQDDLFVAPLVPRCLEPYPFCQPGVGTEALQAIAPTTARKPVKKTAAPPCGPLAAELLQQRRKQLQQRRQQQQHQQQSPLPVESADSASVCVATTSATNAAATELTAGGLERVRLCCVNFS